MLERNRMAPDEERTADAGGEGHHPCGDAGRNDDQSKRGNAEPGHDRGGDHLRRRIHVREEVQAAAESQTTARTATSPTNIHIGTLRPERPTQVMD